jgi:hypothetical protein
MFKFNPFNIQQTKLIPVPQNIPNSNQPQLQILPVTNNQIKQNLKEEEEYSSESSSEIVEKKSKKKKTTTPEKGEVDNKPFNKDEFFKFVTEKFTKLDEALISLKNEFKPSQQNEANEQVKNISESLVNSKKEPKFKKNNYANIDDSHFNKLKEQYGNIPEDRKNDLYVDNNGKYYLHKNKKKLELNQVNALKLINKKI